jgi:polysaccharide export outer membrane protein
MLNFSRFPLPAAILSVFWVLANPHLSLPILAQQPLPLDEFPSVPNSLNAIGETDYTLGGGDRIQVVVFQVADFSGEHLVLVDGTITLPLIGTVAVQGLTLTEVSNLLSERYKPYLKRPIVTVNVIQPRPLQIAVAGEVNLPGSYTIEQGQTIPLVTDLIRQAGGLTTLADISQVQLKRVIQGKEQTWTLNLWQLLQQGNLAQNLTLRDGDSIIVPTKDHIDLAETRQLADANFGLQAGQEINVAVVGEVYRPGSYKVIPEQVNANIGSGVTATVRRQPPRLTLAVQLAGGIKPLANIRQIEVRRFNRNGTQQVIPVDLWSLLQTGDLVQDIILQEGDTIYIPTAENLPANDSETLATASFAPNTIRINVVGEVLRPGIIEVQPNTPLNQGIMAAGGFEKRRANETEVILIRLNPNGTVTQRSIPIDLSQGITKENNPTLQNNDVIIVNRNWLTSATDTVNTILSPVGAVFGIANFINVFR